MQTVCVLVSRLFRGNGTGNGAISGQFDDFLGGLCDKEQFMKVKSQILSDIRMCASIPNDCDQGLCHMTSLL